MSDIYAVPWSLGRMPVEYRLATEAEIEQSRQQLREMNARAREAVRARGITIDPRLAALLDKARDLVGDADIDLDAPIEGETAI